MHTGTWFLVKSQCLDLKSIKKWNAFSHSTLLALLHISSFSLSSPSVSEHAYVYEFVAFLVSSTNFLKAWNYFRSSINNIKEKVKAMLLVNWFLKFRQNLSFKKSTANTCGNKNHIKQLWWLFLALNLTTSGLSQNTSSWVWIFLERIIWDRNIHLN